MKVNSFKTINFNEPLELEEYELPVEEVGEYVVDDSNFIPMSEAVKQLGANNTGTSNHMEYYDFPDGKDNGMSVPINRTKNGKDIAEISSHIMEEVNDIADKVESERKFQQKKAALDKSIQSPKPSNTTPSVE